MSFGLHQYTSLPSAYIRMTYPRGILKVSSTSTNFIPVQAYQVPGILFIGQAYSRQYRVVLGLKYHYGREYNTRLDSNINI